MRLIQLIALLLINQQLFAQQTETRYLSGTGAGHTVCGSILDKWFCRVVLNWCKTNGIEM